MIALGRKLPAEDGLDLREALRQALRFLGLPKAVGEANRVMEEFLGVAIARGEIRAGSSPRTWRCRLARLGPRASAAFQSCRPAVPHPWPMLAQPSGVREGAREASFTLPR